jgi:D-glycero-alpha-D-manno-heptose-7-phosphate kinase
MVISRTPFRISFFGGGTDYPAWSRAHGGAVLATTIDKYCYISCRYLPPFFEHRIRIVYSNIEQCQTIGEIAHPAVREVLRKLCFERGVEIHHDGDLPARSGMGSSSAFTVGLFNAMHALRGQMSSKRQLAVESIEMEQEILKEAVGSQDQISAAYGGFNLIRFDPSGEFEVTPVTISRDRTHELNDHLMLFYTGIKRTASNIAGSFVNDLESRGRQLRMLRAMVDEAVDILCNKDIERFGELLHEAWLAKRALSERVSNPHVEDIYEKARTAGAIGGKLTGAGGGGFMLLFVPPSKQPAVLDALRNLVHVPFKLSFLGSQIMVFDPEQDYASAESTRTSQKIDAFREEDALHGRERSS